MDTRTPQAPKPSANFPKRQHFIPEMVQKHFVDKSGYLWYFDKRRVAHGVDFTTPGNLFLETHLYTIEDDEGVRSGAVERTFSNLEGFASPIIDRVIEIVRRREAPTLSKDDREMLITFMYFQYRRVPDFFRNVKFSQSTESLYLDGIQKWEEEFGPLSPDERDHHLSSRNLKRAEQVIRMRGMVNPSDWLFGVFQGRGLGIAHITASNRSLVLGSFPFARTMADGRRDLGHPDVELWMPVAPDVAIGSLGSEGQQQTFFVSDIPFIRDVNENIARRSNVIASPSRDLVRSLTRRFTRA